MNVKNHVPWDPTASPTFWLNHASRLLMRRFETSLRPLGFGMAYFPVATALEQHGALRQKELAERAHVEQPTMAALLTRMQRDGLITRKPDSSDKRASLVSLTARARSLLPTARVRLADGAERALSGFTDQERATLRALLQRVVANLNDSTN